MAFGSALRTNAITLRSAWLWEDIMALVPKLRNYLEATHIPHDVVAHPRTMTASASAQAAHVPGAQVAKAVVLHDGPEYLVAVVPSTHRLELDAVQDQLGRPVSLATEAEICALFDDCEIGAVPAIGSAYGLKVFCDEGLAAEPEVHFEAGNHVELVRVEGPAFGTLMKDATWGRFSHHA
jgi:Ala-tRNA(Pro) deacylase